MGRLEALIVTALGRSPYGEDVIQPTSTSSRSGVVQTGQKYDDRGHPTNPETQQRIREHTRASNEVMQVAGVVEDAMAIKERDKAEGDSIAWETNIGFRCLEVGKFLCVAGVWGVCGLRRRILLYKSYSAPLSGILRTEIRNSSVLHLMSVGFPSFIMCQVVDWTLGFARGAFDESLLSIINGAVTWTALNYEFFAILQQLGVAPSSGLLPIFKSFIPFSSSSPLQLPSISLLRQGLRGVLPWTSALLWGFAPLASALVYTAADAYISGMVYDPIYHLLPGPLGNVTRQEQILIEIGETLDRLQQHIEEAQAQGVGINGDPHAELPSWDVVSAAAHTAALQALEGRTTNTSDRDHDQVQDNDGDLSDDGSNGHHTPREPMITFDVGPEQVSDHNPSTGMWAAELRNTTELPKQSTYRLTSLTMLPLLLAVDSLTPIVTHIVTLPVEAAMVRIIGRAYGTNIDMFPVGSRVPWKMMRNLLAAYSIELVVTGVIWAGFSLVFQVTKDKFKQWEKKVFGS